MTPTRNPKYTSQRAHVFRPNTLIHHGPNQTITLAEARNRNISFARRSGPPPPIQNKKPLKLRYTQDPIDLSPPRREYLEHPEELDTATPLRTYRPLKTRTHEPFGVHLSHVELKTAQHIAHHLYGSEVLPRGNYNFIVIAFIPLSEESQNRFLAFCNNTYGSGVKPSQVRRLTYKNIR